jgi:aryl-alcohol dehydrogenase-like predicted oxidoreductase
MQFRDLGKSGLKIAPLMLGGNVFGWTADQATSFALLDAFVDGGFNAVDTADSYSRWVSGHKGGESETVIGNWLKKSGKRDRIVLATKAGADMGDGICVRKDYILRSAEASLKRLQTDRIDLYQTHYDNDATPVEETLEAYDQLIKAGKVRAIGTSNMTPARLKESLAASKAKGLPRYESLQPLYNLYDRGFETDYLPICQAETVGVISYFSLAAGFLSGKYASVEDAAKNPARAPRLTRYLDARGDRILKVVREVAARHNAKPAQIALAWLIAKPAITAPIASATSLTQLNELMAAPRLTLGADDMTALDAAGD